MSMPCDEKFPSIEPIFLPRDVPLKIVKDMSIVLRYSYQITKMINNSEVVEYLLQLKIASVDHT